MLRALFPLPNRPLHGLDPGIAGKERVGAMTGWKLAGMLPCYPRTIAM
jgi:hypothetical protein